MLLCYAWADALLIIGPRIAALNLRPGGVEKLQLLDQLEDVEKKSIFNIIDMAISKKRLKDTLTNALSINL